MEDVYEAVNMILFMIFDHASFVCSISFQCVRDKASSWMDDFHFLGRNEVVVHFRLDIFLSNIFIINVFRQGLL